MFDLHSHVLPGIDDGSKDIQMSLEMLGNAKKQGVDVIAATPHCLPESEIAVNEFLQKRSIAYNTLIEKIQGNSEYPRLICGAEVLLGTDISEYSNLKDLCYQNTDYILLEMIDDYKTSNITEWVYNIKIKGLKPVIAHVDRYSKCFELIEELSPLGVIFQINAGRFLSMGGRKKLKDIFSRYDRFFVSSDMHNTTTRCCNIQKAHDVAVKKFTPLCNMLFEDMGKCIVNNK